MIDIDVQLLTFALFMGPALVLTAVDPSWAQLNAGPPMLGLPVSEAYIDPLWAPVQRAMRAVYWAGEPVAMQVPTGVITIAPFRRDDRVVGVVTAYRRSTPTPAQLPRPRDPQPV